MTSLSDRCPGCGFDPSSVSPSDASVALRSFPRRFTELTEGLEDRPDLAAHALESAERTAAAANAAAAALTHISHSDVPDVSLTNAAAAGPDELVAAVGALAAAIDATSGKEWQRTGTDPQFGTVTALDVVRHAVHAGSHELRAITRATDADD